VNAAIVAVYRLSRRVRASANFVIKCVTDKQAVEAFPFA